MQFKLRLPASTLLLILIMSCGVNANGQDDSNNCAFHPNEEARVESLPPALAASKNESAVLAASLAIAIMEPDVCCGRNSVLEDQVASATGLSLRQVGEKLRGKHYSGDGLPIVVADQYWSGASVNAEEIIATLQAQRPLLMDWNGHLYVLYGVVYDENLCDDGSQHSIQKLLLVDTRFADHRRYVSFNRQTDDWGKVNGLLALTITRDK